MIFPQADKLSPISLSITLVRIERLIPHRLEFFSYLSSAHWKKKKKAFSSPSVIIAEGRAAGLCLWHPTLLQCLWGFVCAQHTHRPPCITAAPKAEGFSPKEHSVPAVSCKQWAGCDPRNRSHEKWKEFETSFQPNGELGFLDSTFARRGKRELCLFCSRFLL